ncbi:MAG: hypothetical protein K6E85_06835 [Lachnospiraceae bacterium]|nr:hypothetical protein [Lachnospiraceae bacterium]
MDKGVYIALIVLCFLVICVVFYFLILKITRKIGRLPIKGLITLLVLLVGIIILLFYFGLFNDKNGMQNGNNPEGTGAEQNGESVTIPEVPENSILLMNDEIWMDGKRIDRSQLKEKVSEFIEPRIDKAIDITIIDDYSSSELIKEVEKVLIDHNLEREKGYTLERREN